MSQAAKMAPTTRYACWRIRCDQCHLATVAVNINATNDPTPLTLVKRDGSGNFAGGTISATLFSGPLSGAVTGNVTGNLFGNATSATMSNTAQWFSVDLDGDVKGPQLTNYVYQVGGVLRQLALLQEQPLPTQPPHLTPITPSSNVTVLAILPRT